ncbi:MAG: tetratricopeptide repeat protein [Ignavibacteria bacterium]|nr:tetratricopeptide repeat protein [Ignavibacteria bacterium]
MTNAQLEAQTKLAGDETNKGNYDAAQILAQQVIDILDNRTDDSTSTENDANTKGTINTNDLIDEQQDTTTIRANAMLALALNNYNQGDFLLALEQAHQGLVQAQAGEITKSIPQAWNIIGKVHISLGDYDKALEFFNNSLVINEEIGSKNGIAKNLTNIGGVYGRISDYPQALTYFQKALAIYEEIGRKDGIANNLINIGSVYQYLSDYPQALTYYQKAISINEEIGSKEGIARDLGNIGIVYQNLSDYPQALTYFQKALAINEEIGSKEGIASNLTNIGNAYHDLSDNPQALTYYQKALAIYEEIGSKDGIATNLGNIGIVYHNLSDYPQALTYYQKALAINEKIGRKNGIVLNLGNMGGLYANKEFYGYDTDKAEEFFLSAIALSEDIGQKQNLYGVHKSLADLYETQERWKEHSIQFKKYHTIKEEVQSEEATKQAQQMEYRRKAEESERDRQVKLARFQEQEKILHNILPSQIADRMIEGEKTIADSHEHVSVFFSDIVGFTKLSQQVSAQELVGMLNGIFSQFDQLARKHGLEKIKTIGDAYMAVCGAPIPVANHAERTALFALEVAVLMDNYTTDSGDKVSIRIGLHTGSVVAGIIGENKFAYDMWGDAVNTASRMESHGEAGKIHVSQEFMHALSPSSPSSLHFAERGEMEIKGKGKMKTYFLEKA